MKLMFTVGAETMTDYMMLHDRCAICHWPVDRKGRTLELHHIVGGPGRKNPEDGSNWLCTCSRCHHAIHARLPDYGEVSKGAVLTAKIQEDGPLDLEALAKLRGKAHLGYDPEPIPEKFLADRQRNGGDRWP
jgi:hypothetical protein